AAPGRTPRMPRVLHADVQRVRCGRLMAGRVEMYQCAMRDRCGQVYILRPPYPDVLDGLPRLQRRVERWERPERVALHTEAARRVEADDLRIEDFWRRVQRMHPQPERLVIAGIEVG